GLHSRALGETPFSVGGPEDAEIEADGVEGEVENGRTPLEIERPTRDEKGAERHADSERTRQRDVGSAEGIGVGDVHAGRFEEERTRDQRCRGPGRTKGGSGGKRDIEIAVESPINAVGDFFGWLGRRRGRKRSQRERHRRRASSPKTGAR